MVWLTLLPDAPQLRYENVFHVHIDEERAVFERCFDPEWPCGVDASGTVNGPSPELQAPGATIGLLTDAPLVRATLEYVRECDVGCPTQHVGETCYVPTPPGTCEATCAPTLFVDGERRSLPTASVRRRFSGISTLDLLVSHDQSGPRPRHVELVLPWTAIVHFRGLEVGDDDGGEVALGSAPPRRPFRYLAYGDSITQGFCGDAPYPEEIGRLNNWTAVNLGWGGMYIKPEQAVALGQTPADLISVLIGTNNRGTCDVGPAFKATLEALRAGNARVPIVVVTMLRRAGESKRQGKCQRTLEDLREQLRREVRQRQQQGDDNVYLVEGQPLLPLSEFSDGLHPGSGDAQRTLAYQLNAAFHDLGLASEFRCYAERYPDLLVGYCRDDPGQCDWTALQGHWDSAGRSEGRIMGCTMPPTPPVPPAAPQISPPPPPSPATPPSPSPDVRPASPALPTPPASGAPFPSRSHAPSLGASPAGDAPAGASPLLWRLALSDASVALWSVVFLGVAAALAITWCCTCRRAAGRDRTGTRGMVRPTGPARLAAQRAHKQAGPSRKKHQYGRVSSVDSDDGGRKRVTTRVGVVRAPLRKARRPTAPSGGMREGR